MTAPHITPPSRSSIPASRRTLRADERPGFDADVMRRFRDGSDTLEIAHRLSVHESLVVRALARARNAERCQ